MSQVAALRELLERRFPTAIPPVERGDGAIGTGIRALDRAFPGGGLPRGRLVSWAPGVGTGAVLRSACGVVTAGGERAAWVDGSSVVVGDGWSGEGSLFRPSGGVQALKCAEELVRCGGFALVVVTGAKARDAERVRLAKLAREGGGSLVMVEDGGFMAGVRVVARVGVGSWEWRLDPFGDPAGVDAVRVRARVTAAGWSEEAEFSLRVMDDDLRMSLEPALGDRRGGAR